MWWIWSGVSIVVVIIWVVTLWDVFRRADLSAGAKVGWSIAIIVLPVLATIVYVIARPSSVDYRSSAPATPEQAEKAREQAETIERARAAEQQAPDEGRFNIR
jgi:hypothetical protein